MGRADVLPLDVRFCIEPPPRGDALCVDRGNYEFRTGDPRTVLDGLDEVP